MNAIKAHIFDLDGTLLDSMGIWVEIDRAFMAKRGIPFPSADEYEKYVTAVTPLNPTESAAYVIEYHGLNEQPEDVSNEWNAMAEDAYARTIQLKHGAREFLKSLKKQGAKMAIATSSPAVLCMPALRNHRIEGLFDAICLSEEVGYGKSRPEVFLLAAERLNVRPEDCIVYEDSLTAAKTAKNIGMTVCGVYDHASEKNWREIEAIADYIIYDFASI